MNKCHAQYSGIANNVSIRVLTLVIGVCCSGCKKSPQQPLDINAQDVKSISISVERNGGLYTFHDEESINAILDTLSLLYVASEPAASMVLPCRLHIIAKDGSESSFAISSIRPLGSAPQLSPTESAFYLDNFLIEIEGVVYMGETSKIVNLFKE